MIAANHQVNVAAKNTASRIIDGSIVENVFYPPSIEFSSEEKAALIEISKIPGIQSALQKVIADSTASAFFHFFNYLDGTGHPNDKFGKWTWATILDHPNGDKDPYIQMLHDSFYDAYTDWNKIEGEDV